MNLDQFTHYMDEFGVNFERWPDELRSEAGQFALTNLAAFELIQQECDLQSWMRSGQSIPYNPQLAERIIQRSRFLKPVSQHMHPLLAMAAALMLMMCGFLAGYFSHGLINTQGLSLQAALNAYISVSGSLI